MTILDDEPFVSFALAASSVTESAGPAQLLVTLTTRAGFPATTQFAGTVKYATKAGTALATTDYTTTSGTLTFPAASSNGATLAISVPIVDDSLSEANETFTCTLSAPVSAHLGAIPIDTVTIVDDDPLPTVSVSDAPTVTRPAAGSKVNAVFTVSLSAASGQSVTVNYATADGSAIAPGDYTAKSAILTFAAGTVSKTVSVSVIGSSAVQPSEVFLLNMSSAVASTLDRGQAQAVIKSNTQPSSCSPFLTMPFTISTPGTYCLAGPVSTSLDTGAAVSINSDDVILDLGGFNLDGAAAGTATQADGVFALSRRGITVRNGAVSGFYRGVHLQDIAPFVTARGAKVQGVQALNNTLSGIWVEGSDSVISGNRVAHTGATAVGGPDVATFGIATFGPRPRVLANDIIDTVGVGGGVADGIQVNAGAGAVVSRNKTGNSTAGFSQGIDLVGSSNVLLEKNQLTGVGLGIVFDSASTGKYRKNLTSGVVTPFTGGTDGGGNE